MTQLTKPLTGNQYTITHGDYKATVCEQGGILRQLSWKGKNLLAGFDPDKPVPCCNGYMLIPYPNRIEGGSYTFEGKDYQFPIDEVTRHNAIHGLGYRSMWSLVALRDDAVELEWRNSAALESYPFAVSATVTYRVSDEGLSLTMTVHNNGDVDAPWAFGIHPWISNGKDLYGNDPIMAQNDLCSLKLGARKRVLVDENLIPTGESVDVAGSEYDFLELTSLKGKVLDDAFEDVVRDERGHSQAVFTRPDGISVTLDGDETVTSWQVCNGFGFPADKHPSGVAVEPMTGYANAFKTGKNLVVVKPSESFATTITFSAEQN